MTDHYPGSMPEPVTVTGCSLGSACQCSPPKPSCQWSFSVSRCPDDLGLRSRMRASFAPYPREDRF